MAAFGPWESSRAQMRFTTFFAFFGQLHACVGWSDHDEACFFIFYGRRDGYTCVEVADDAEYVRVGEQKLCVGYALFRVSLVVLRAELELIAECFECLFFLVEGEFNTGLEGVTEVGLSAREWALGSKNDFSAFCPRVTTACFWCAASLCGLTAACECHTCRKDCAECCERCTLFHE